MWTNENRCLYDRDHLRYPSDLTDAEWALITALIPPAKHGGRKREVDERKIADGIMYLLSTGCQWRAIPKDLPPRSTVHGYLGRWQWDGTLERIHHALYVQCRELAGREASPTVGIIDSQSVKSAEKGGVSTTQTIWCSATIRTRRRATISMLKPDVTAVLAVASASDRPFCPSLRKAWHFRPPPPAASGLTEP